MNYVDLDELTAALQTRLKGLGLFRDVVVSNATDTGQLAEEMEAAAAPAAIIGLGEVEYDERGCVRTLRPVVVVLDVFRRGGDRRSEGVWTLAKAVEGFFLPDLESGGGYAKLLGIEFWPVTSRPLALCGALAAVAVSLEGVEYI